MGVTLYGGYLIMGVSLELGLPHIKWWFTQTEGFLVMGVAS